MGEEDEPFDREFNEWYGDGEDEDLFDFLCPYWWEEEEEEDE